LFLGYEKKGLRVLSF